MIKGALRALPAPLSHPQSCHFFSRGGFFFENPIGIAIQIFTMLTVGWPLYLFTNVTGQTYKTKEGSSHWVSHFHPNNLFQSKYKGLPKTTFVLLSDAGLLVMVALVTYFCNRFGFLCMMRVYGLPYLIVNFWLVLITELQHTDTRLPHYSGR
jgi:omega-6 fatty acid desaturase (delta-12 desaturase)